MDLRAIHAGLGNAVLLFTFVTGLWALFNAWRRAPLGGDFWGAIVIGEGLIVAQAVVGLFMLLQFGMPSQWVHILYGVFATIVWPAACTFLYRRDVPNLDARRQATLFGLVCLFLAGVALRAITTAR